MDDKDVFYAACRSDFYTFAQKAFAVIDDSQPFKHNWHLELICDKLQKCAEGKIKRLIINIPPRNLKSHCATICLPAFILGHNPNSRIVCVSYAQTLSSKLSRKSRDLMQSDFYKKVFKTRLGNKNTESEFDTSQNGYRMATSVEGGITGDGGNILIIDDPIKADDAVSDVKRNNVNDWYNRTFASRLNNKIDGVIILIMQRLHVDDLTGHLLKQNGWELLSLAAIAEDDETFELSDGRIVCRKTGESLNPSLEPVCVLEEQRRIMSNHHFSAQYQQNPIPTKGNIINFDDFLLFNKSEILQQGYIIQSWDIALKDGKDNDYSVCVSARYYNGIIYIEDIYRCKLYMLSLVEKIHQQKAAYNCEHIIIEDSSISTHLLQYLKKEGKVHPLLYRPKGDKVSLANNAALHIKSEKVKLLRCASWLDELKAEINAFPYSKHDDQVDSLTQLIDMVFSQFNEINLTSIANAMKNNMQQSPAVQTKRQVCQQAFKLYQRSTSWRPPF